MSLGNFFRAFKEPLIGAGIGGVVGAGVGKLESNMDSRIKLYSNYPSYRNIKSKKKKIEAIKRDILTGGAVAGMLAGGMIGLHIKADNMQRDRFRNSYNNYDDFFRSRQRSSSGNAGRAQGGSTFFRGGNVLSDMQKTLGLHGKETTKEEVKKGFRNAAKATHPDAGGKEEDFKKVNDAYENIKKMSWFQKLAFWKGFNHGS